MIWVHTWLVMLSHIVMSVVQVFIFMMLSLACIIIESFGLPSIMM
jgi:F0F1-type ATP synthase membrane subunit a